VKDPRKKLGAHSRRDVKLRDKRGTIDALVRLVQPPTGAQRKALTRAGCRITAAAGAVVSINIDAARVEELATLDFVCSIETARALRAER